MTLSGKKRELVSSVLDNETDEAAGPKTLSRSDVEMLLADDAGA